MRFRTLLLVFALLCVVTAPALATKYTGKTSPFPMNTGIDTRDIFEGFEGAFPPAGWTAVSNSGHSDIEAWYQGSNAFEGLYAATCEWDPDLIPQDNVMSFMHTVAAGEDHINFQISGSAYWSANYDCTVEVNGDIVYSWAANVTDDWVFTLVDINLADYMDQTVEIAFRYIGLDGAAIYLDNVGLNEGYEPPPPPEPPLNDTVQGALDNGFEIPPGEYYFAGDNTLANSDYPLATGSCTGYSFTGADVVYFVCLDQGDTFSVVMTNDGFDASIYLMTDPADPFGSCVIGADDPEEFSYTAEAEGMYYLVVGAYASGLGAFEITGFNSGGGCVVATDNTTFGGLKSFYR